MSMKGGAPARPQDIRKGFLGFLVFVGTVIERRRIRYHSVHLKKRFPERRLRRLMLKDPHCLGFKGTGKSINPCICIKQKLSQNRKGQKA